MTAAHAVPMPRDIDGLATVMGFILDHTSGTEGQEHETGKQGFHTNLLVIPSFVMVPQADPLPPHFMTRENTLGGMRGRSRDFRCDSEVLRNDTGYSRLP